MPQLVLFLLRLGVLVVLWLFVAAAIFAIRGDLSGRRAARAGVVPPPAPNRAPAKRVRGGQKRSAARKLVVTQGALAGTTVPLGDGVITIGRANDSTLVLTDDYVSARHARLAPNGDSWVVEDMGSTNGTYLDRQRVSGPTPVPLGVPIRIGKTVMELRR